MLLDSSLPEELNNITIRIGSVIEIKLGKGKKNQI